MLSLAKYYAEHPAKYTVVCIAFAGEEAGLLGSAYYVNHPMIDLQRIRFLVNLDLVGNGDEGITVVNATEFPQAFTMMQRINEEKKLLVAVNSRGKARNSDHYWFTEKGVPSFFIYTLGGIKAYHDVYDVDSTLPNDHYVQLYKLLTTFVGNLQK